jgi:hypothetical protein
LYDTIFFSKSKESGKKSYSYELVSQALCFAFGKSYDMLSLLLQAVPQAHHNLYEGQSWLAPIFRILK